MLYYTARGRSTGPSITLALVAANVIVFIVLLLGGDRLLLLLAQTGELFFAGDYWQVFTAMFVHFDLLHIAFNMFALVYFGRLDEVSYSKTEYLTIYLGAGFVGNVASLYLLPANVPTGGASGAIFGLLGAYVASERKGANMVLAVLFAALIFLDSIGPDVNVFAHLFGLGVGLLLGYAFTQRNRRQSGGEDGHGGGNII
jgi:rhomboid protease GluP